MTILEKLAAHALMRAQDKTAKLKELRGGI